jgi:PAS domain S-box-containing protein
MAGQEVRLTSSAIDGGRAHRRDRRQSQATLEVAAERFTTAYASSPYGLALTTPEGEIFDVNPAFERLSGIARRQLLGIRLVDRIVVDDVSRVEDILARALGRAAAPTPVLVRMCVGDAVRWVEITATHVRARSGAPLMFVVHVEDRSDHVAVLDGLGHAFGVSLVGRLASSVVHDLRNLLAVVAAEVELLGDGGGDGDTRRHLGTVRTAAARADAITAQLLDIARASPLTLTVVDVAGLVRSMEPILRAYVSGGRSLSVDVETALVEADPVQLERVLLSLVVNACDAVDPEGHVAVAVRPTGDEVELVVRDDGAGIEPTTLCHVFDPFFSTKGARGTGLGLATSHSTITAFGGDISIESTPGEGTTVTIRLPAVVAS